MCTEVDTDADCSALLPVAFRDRPVLWHGREIQILTDTIIDPQKMRQNGEKATLKGVTPCKTSCHFSTSGTQTVGIGYINGMCTSFAEALDEANHIKSFARDDILIEGVYNHSNGSLIDLLEIIFLNYNDLAPITANLLLENWTRFHEENRDNPHAKYLQFGHSMGGILMKVALKKASPEIRNRIIAVTLGTAYIIPDDLCFKSVAYASKSDLVHYGQDAHQRLIAAFCEEEERLQLLNALTQSKSKLILLEPHPEARGLDHGILSPTNFDVIEHWVSTHLTRKGNY